VAYVVGKVQSAPTISELRSFLKKKLPDYMMPGAFVMLDALPLSANGKVDRRALPAPGAARADWAETFTAPGTPIEKRLAEIFIEVLKLDRVGIRDNFFELGGHSLLATRVVSRIRTVFQVEVAIRCLFQSPTIIELAAEIEEMMLDQITRLSEEEVQRLTST
jgi:acyl carrier protein